MIGRVRVWLRASSRSAVITVITVGVSCRFSSRNCAVTTTSVSTSLPADSVSCASATPCQLANELQTLCRIVLSLLAKG